MRRTSLNRASASFRSPLEKADRPFRNTAAGLSSPVPFNACTASSSLPARALSRAGRRAAASAAAAALIRSRKKPSTCGVRTADLSNASIRDANAIGAAGFSGAVEPARTAATGPARVTRKGRMTCPTLRPLTEMTARATYSPGASRPIGSPASTMRRRPSALSAAWSRAGARAIALSGLAVRNLDHDGRVRELFGRLRQELEVGVQLVAGEIGGHRRRGVAPVLRACCRRAADRSRAAVRNHSTGRRWCARRCRACRCRRPRRPSPCRSPAARRRRPPTAAPAAANRSASRPSSPGGSPLAGPCRPASHTPG